MSEKSYGKVFLYWIQLYRTIFQFGRQWKWWKIVHILYHIFYRDLVCYRSCKIHFIQFLWMHSIWDILVQIKSQSRIKQHHIFQIPFLPKVQKLSLLMEHLSTTQAKKIFTVIAYNLYFENYILKVVEMHIFYRFIQFCNFPHTM